MSENLYGHYADQQADAFGLPRWVVRAVIAKESGWDSGAIGSSGEVGLMQLKPAAAVEGGISAVERSNPWANMRAGVKYLRKQVDAANQDLHTGLGRYNQGPSGAYDEKGGLTGSAAAYADSILSKRGAQATGTTPMGTSEPRPADVAENDCPDFSWWNPGTWIAGFKCAFKSGLMVLLVAGLVLYAGRAALKGGG